MRKLILLAGAAALATGLPALAKPGKGHGHAAHGPAKGHVRTAPARTRTPRAVRPGPNYGVNACPPGLAAKGNGCLPPGQARRLFSVGQRIPVGYNFYTPYSEIPLAYRDRYGLATDGRYIYRDDAIYVVDPTTSLVSRIIDLVR